MNLMNLCETKPFAPGGAARLLTSLQHCPCAHPSVSLRASNVAHTQSLAAESTSHAYNRRLNVKNDGITCSLVWNWSSVLLSIIFRCMTRYPAFNHIGQLQNRDSNACKCASDCGIPFGQQLSQCGGHLPCSIPLQDPTVQRPNLPDHPHQNR